MILALVVIIWLRLIAIIIMIMAIIVIVIAFESDWLFQLSRFVIGCSKQCDYFCNDCCWQPTRMRKQQ